MCFSLYDLFLVHLCRSARFITTQNLTTVHLLLPPRSETSYTLCSDCNEAARRLVEAREPPRKRAGHRIVCQEVGVLALA